MQDNYPILISCKTLKPEFENLQKIKITSDNVSVGRSLNNSIVLPFLAISRNHCVIRKYNDEEWVIEDCSSFGIEVNGRRLGKGVKRKLQHEDIIKLEPSEEFVYKYMDDKHDDFQCPKKRIKLEPSHVNNDMIDNMKIKFEESQSFEVKHIEQKILNAQQMQTTSKILKDQLELDLNRKIQQLENDFALQIENLKGEKNEVENQKAILIEERDALLATVKTEMETKINDLMEQVRKHNETESELLNENNCLKEKLLKEREDFLNELSRESSSKQDLLDKLEARVREQEETRLQEKKQLELMLKNETEQLRLAKETELKQLQEAKRKKELELEEELNRMKENLEEQVKESEQQRIKADQLMNEQKQLMTKINNEEKAKMELLVQEREEIQKKLAEAKTNSEKSLEELRTQVSNRETELAALAAERIQQQAEQSSEVITSLQEQLEKVKGQLQSVESEKNNLLENLCLSAPTKEGTSKQATLEEVGELMENELQCSVCAELFVAATTLNCSHTFCKYCITMWKRKKKDCPICRTAIISECKSLVLDSFIEKMVQNLTEDMKKKRQEMLKSREELELELTSQLSVGTSRGGGNHDNEFSDEDYSEEGGEEEEEYDEDLDDSYWSSRWRRGVGFEDDFSESESDYGWSSDSDGGSHATGSSAPRPAGTAPASSSDTSADSRPTSLSNSTGSESNSNGGTRRRGRIAGVPGSYFGGYGRCFHCGARGHWAPGCPFR